jgi:hypothetical protein
MNLMKQLIALVAVISTLLPLLAQTAVPKETANGLMLGSPFVAPDGQHVTKATLQPFPIEQKSTIDAEVFIDDDGQGYMVWSRRRMTRVPASILASK